jgi:hypothetical protein
MNISNGYIWPIGIYDIDAAFNMTLNYLLFCNRELV